jgi:hypothetical protein
MWVESWLCLQLAVPPASISSSYGMYVNSNISFLGKPANKSMQGLLKNVDHNVIYYF